MTLADLAADPTQAPRLSREDALARLAEAAGLVAVLQAVVTGRWAEGQPAPAPERALTASEAAALLGVKVGTLYNGRPIYHTFRLPGTRRYSAVWIAEYLRDPDGYARHHAGRIASSPRAGRPALRIGGERRA